MYTSIIYTSIVYFNILMVHRCKCGNCVLAFVVKPDECRCCLEIDPCKEKMLEEHELQYDSIMLIAQLNERHAIDKRSS